MSKLLNVWEKIKKLEPAKISNNNPSLSIIILPYLNGYLVRNTVNDVLQLIDMIKLFAFNFKIIHTTYVYMYIYIDGRRHESNKKSNYLLLTVCTKLANPFVSI